MMNRDMAPFLKIEGPCSKCRRKAIHLHIPAPGVLAVPFCYRHALKELGIDVRPVVVKAPRRGVATTTDAPFLFRLVVSRAACRWHKIAPKKLEAAIRLAAEVAAIVSGIDARNLYTQSDIVKRFAQNGYEESERP